MRAEATQISDSPILYDPRVISTSLSLPVARIANIDRLRILAAIGIVWFHTHGAPLRQIAYAGLPAFLLIFFSLITMQGPLGTTTDFLRRRYRRLLKPWLFWSVLYGLCRVTRAMHTMDVGSLREMLSIETFLAGTSIHLWYLPYACVSGLFVHEFNRRTSRANHAVVALAATVVGTIILAAHAMGVLDHRLIRPLLQWEFGLAAIPLGIAVGRCLLIPCRNQQRLLLAAISLIAVAECQVLYSLGFGSPAVPYAIAVVLVCLAYGWEIDSDIVVASLAPLTFGVYLVHPLVAYALRPAMVSHGHCVTFVLLTVCISAAIVQGLMRTPIRRFM